MERGRRRRVKSGNKWKPMPAASQIHREKWTRKGLSHHWQKTTTTKRNGDWEVKERGNSVKEESKK